MEKNLISVNVPNVITIGLMAIGTIVLCVVIIQCVIGWRSNSAASGEGE